jgi:hypothetical protein
MKYCKYCKTNANWHYGGEVYCKIHAPAGSRWRSVCSALGCALTPNYRQNNRRYCQHHAPAGSVGVHHCRVEGCFKTRARGTTLGNMYCKRHASEVFALEFDSFLCREIRAKCGEFIQCDGYVFSYPTYDIVVQQTTEEYIPLPWNRPTTIILYNTCTVDVLCAAINAERAQFTGGVIYLP